MPANREIDPALYRTAGYRVCGERAVRVDILERLADLIRPALSWREGERFEAARRDRRRRLYCRQRHDVADRCVRRGFCLDPALARLSHGAPAETAGTGDSVTEPAAGPSAVEPIQEAAATSDGEAGAPPTDAEAPAESIDRIIVPAIDAAESAMAEAAPEVQAESAAGRRRTQDVSPSTEFHAEPQPASKRLALPRQSRPPRMLRKRLRCRTSLPREPVLIEVWRPGRTEGGHRPRQKHRDRHRSKNAGTAPAQRAAGAGFGRRSGRRGGSFAAGRTDAARQRIGARSKTTIRATAAGMPASIDPIGRSATAIGRNASVTVRRSSASSGARKRPIQIRRLPSLRP